MHDLVQPISETVGPDRAYARVWQSVRAMTPERLARFGVSARIDDDRVIVEQGNENLTIERIKCDRYEVEATSGAIAAMAILALTLPRDQRGIRPTA